MHGMNSTQPRRDNWGLEGETSEATMTQSGREAVFSEYAGLRLELARALSALHQSRAEYDTLSAALDKAKAMPALRQKLRRQQIAQAAAMADSSLTCAHLNEEQLALAPRINAEWESLSEELRRLPPATPEQQNKALADLAAGMAAMRERFKLTDAEIEAIRSRLRHLAEGPKEPAQIPTVLLDDDWQKATERIAAHHRQTAAAYSELKDRLDHVVAAGRQRPDGRQ